MKNVFKNAKFGKAYKTRDGRKALYLVTLENGPCGICHKLAIEDEECNSYYDCEGLNYEGGYAVDDNGDVIEYWDTDIVSEWKEEINVKELDKLAEEEYPYVYNNSFYGDDECEHKNGLRAAFKIGYLKAKEE